MMKLLLVNHHYVESRPENNVIFPSPIIKLLSQMKKIEDFGYEYLDKIQLFDTDFSQREKKYYHYTFDDGLSEQMQAYEELSALGKPPSIYISTSKYRLFKPDLVHLIHYVRYSMDDKDIINKVCKDVDLVSLRERAATQYRYDTQDVASLKYYFNFIANPEVLSIKLQSLVKLINPNYFDSFYLSRNELDFLGKKGVLGSHSDDHVPIGRLEFKDQIDQVRKSKEFFDSIGVNADVISYPYGGPDAIPNRLAVNKYYKYGITMKRGSNELGQDNLMLSRIDTNDVDKYLQGHYDG